MQNFQKDNKGFSLIEVMVAMVLLALISIPLMNNFATSAKLNSSSRQIQDANTIGQKAMEQVKSVSVEDTYKKFNALGNSNLDVFVDNDMVNVIAEDTDYLRDKKKYTFRETGIPGDVGNYNVEVTVDATPFDTMVDNAGNVTDGPNRAMVPNLLQIGGDNNAVFSDNGTTLQQALDQLYPIHFAACDKYGRSPKTKSELAQDLTKEMILYLEDSDKTDNKVSVRLEYVYYVDKGSGATQPYGLKRDTSFTPISIGDLEVEDIRNIYIFYHAFDPKPGTIGEGIKIINGSSNENRVDQKIQLYFIAQETDPPITAGYKLQFRDNPIPECIDNVFLNVDPSYSGTPDIFKDDLIDHTKNQRLYEVTVKVYKGTAVAPYDASDLLAEFRSTKGE